MNSTYHNVCNEKIKEMFNELNTYPSITDSLRWKKYLLAQIINSCELVREEMEQAKLEAIDGHR